MVVVSELSLLRIKSRSFLMFSCKLRLAGQHYIFGIVLFPKIICQKLPYASKRTIEHG